VISRAARDIEMLAGTMQVEDFNGTSNIDDADSLVRHLRTVRQGPYGSFILCHSSKEPSLWIMINCAVAYVHYMPDIEGGHAGFQPTGMTPKLCDDNVQFVLTDGSVGSGVTMPASTLVSTDAAYAAAVEFFGNPGLPPSIHWLEL